MVLPTPLAPMINKQYSYKLAGGSVGSLGRTSFELAVFGFELVGARLLTLRVLVVTLSSPF